MQGLIVSSFPSIFWPVPILSLFQGAFLLVLLGSKITEMSPFLSGALFLGGAVLAFIVMHLGSYFVFKKYYIGSFFGKAFVDAFLERPKKQHTKRLVVAQMGGLIFVSITSALTIYLHTGFALDVLVAWALFLLFIAYTSARTYYVKASA